MTWAGLWSGLGGYVSDTWPRWFSLFGGLALVAVLLTLPGDVTSLRQNTRLGEVGRTTTAVIVQVDHLHHSSARGGSWDEYWPITRQTVNGDTFTASLRRYGSSSPDRYEPGQRVPVMYDPDHHWTVALAGTDARLLLQRQLQKAVVVGSVAFIVFGVGLPFDIRRSRRRRRKTTKPQAIGIRRAR